MSIITETRVSYPKTVIDDPILGKLYYEIYEDKTDSCKFDKNKNICQMPFYDIDVHANGNVYICCTSWNPACIGNLLEEDLTSIWTGIKAQTVRNSITDGSYRYCNSKTCTMMLAGEGHKLLPKDTFKAPNSKFPSNVVFSIDYSCNLVCPSCRSVKSITPDNFDRSLTILRKVFDSVFSEPHDQHITITFDGAGEIFFSPVYRELFDTAEVFKTPEKWPNFRLCLCTNGTMMTEKIQNKYKVLFDRASWTRISVDAGNKSSYEIVRRGGDWDLLWKNLDYLYHNTIKQDPEKNWAWNVILQRDNLESIPELVKLAYNYPDKLPEISIVNILKWGVASQKEFDDMAVWIPDNPYYERAKEILSLPEVVQFPKIFMPILK